jgi:hypothetical protein
MNCDPRDPVGLALLAEHKAGRPISCPRCNHPLEVEILGDETLADQTQPERWSISCTQNRMKCWETWSLEVSKV